LLSEAKSNREEMMSLIDSSCNNKYGVANHDLLRKCHAFLAGQLDSKNMPSFKSIVAENCPSQSAISLQPLPRVQAFPTTENPFVFIHIEKTAGSTLRQHLFETAVARNYSCFIPGKNRCVYHNNSVHSDIDKLPHMTFNLLSDVAHQRPTQILAGHFEWGVWNHISEPPRHVSCFITLRDPVARVLSLYYERLFSLTRVPISSLSAEELETYMIAFVGGGKDGTQLRDEGFSNGAVKALSSANVHKGRYHNTEAPIHRPLSFSLALKRMEQCVVGIQEDWHGTTEVLRHWFPWIQVMN
jgi:hypothetical protein